MLESYNYKMFVYFTFKMSNYPALQENVEKNVISFIHNNRPKYKQSILSLIDMELAYINTKHEEFKTNMYVQVHSNIPFSPDSLHFFPLISLICNIPFAIGH